MIGKIAGFLSGRIESPGDIARNRHRRLDDVHGVSWWAGGILAAVLVACGPPYILTAHAQCRLFDLTDLLLYGEPLAMVASTVYAVERLVRSRPARLQVTLKEFLVAIATLCVVVSVIVDQHRRERQLAEMPWMDMSPLPLVGGPWVFRLPLLLGLVCPAYALVTGTFWAVGKAIWWLTHDWEGCSQQEEGR